SMALLTISTLSLHDALPIFFVGARVMNIENRYDFDIMNGEQGRVMALIEDNDTENTQKRTLVRVRFPDVKKISREHSPVVKNKRSEEHTSELQSRENLVCRL